MNEKLLYDATKILREEARSHGQTLSKADLKDAEKLLTILLTGLQRQGYVVKQWREFEPAMAPIEMGSEAACAWARGANFVMGDKPQ